MTLMTHTHDTCVTQDNHATHDTHVTQDNHATYDQCFRSGSAWIHIIGGLLDPDPHGQIWIQEVKSSEIKLKSEKKITRTI